MHNKLLTSLTTQQVVKIVTKLISRSTKRKCFIQLQFARISISNYHEIFCSSDKSSVCAFCILSPINNFSTFCCPRTWTWISSSWDCWGSWNDLWSPRCLRYFRCLYWWGWFLLGNLWGHLKRVKVHFEGLPVVQGTKIEKEIELFLPHHFV